MNKKKTTKVSKKSTKRLKSAAPKPIELAQAFDLHAIEKHVASGQMDKSKKEEYFMRLRASGLSYARIASILKVSKTTLIEWGRVKHLEIANLQTIEFEALREEIGLTYRARLQALGAIMRGLVHELASRDLSLVRTEKLVEILLRVINDAGDLMQPQIELKGVDRTGLAGLRPRVDVEA